MKIANLVLEYLRVILTFPVVVAVIATTFLVMFSEDIKALLLRVAKIKLPGGTEVSTPQSTRSEEGELKKPPEPPSGEISGIPADLTPEQRQIIEQLVKSHIANAYLWEYRYLNYYLARGTQMVLDWLIGLPQPTTYAHYDSSWLPLIPSSEERSAIMSALENHHLIIMDRSTNLITVTPKGREYREWRGELPALTKLSS